MQYGWIKLHRQITEHWLWEEKPFSKGQAWIDLLLQANHKENKVPFGNQLISIERGEFLTSESKLAERWGWSRKKVRNFLTMLSQDGMIENIKMPNKGTRIKIVNYGVYQDLGDNTGTTKDTTQEQLKNNRGTTEEQLRNTNKNNKNDKNEKEYKEVVVVVDNSQQQLKKIFEVFEQNIHPPTPLEIKKLESWLEDVEADVIMLAIEEAVSYNKRNLKYIESILKNWTLQGLKTKESVEAYLRDWKDEKGVKKETPGEEKHTANNETIQRRVTAALEFIRRTLGDNPELGQALALAAEYGAEIVPLVEERLRGGWERWNVRNVNNRCKQ